MNKFEVLQKYFGYDTFRPGQEQIIDAILNGQDVLGVMPTGAGKSICYQIPALMLDGLTIVISPLISLMKDQVMALNKAGVPAGCINSGITRQEYGKTMGLIRSQHLKLLYVAPERLLLDGFLEQMKDQKISMVAIDEAHCVSQWGQDFRPDYLKILDFIHSLGYRPVIAAFTATATRVVKQDIASILQLHHPFTITTGFDRPNLTFTVIHPKNKDTALLSLLAGKPEESGIVYCATRKEVERVTELLAERGYKVGRYHAGLSAEERKQTQEDFIYDRLLIIVATNAFGMGIDKPNVSFVIHYNMPKSMEAYYQEAGRAGRDGNEAEAILLYSREDLGKNQYLISHSDPNPDLSVQEQEAARNRDIKRLYAMDEYANSCSCLRSQILAYFGEEGPDRCEKCSNCLKEFEQTDITIPAQKILSCVIRSGQRYGRTKIINILYGANTQDIRAAGLDRLSVYGLMKEDGKKEIEEDIQSLLEQNYLMKDGLDYPILKVTRKGIAALKKREPFYRQSVKAQRQSVHHSSLSDDQYTLFEELKNLRRQLAQEERVPAYMIFPDTSLQEMARQVPEDLNAFARIKGVGEAKLEKYGEIFVRTIVEYENARSQEKQEPERQTDSSL